MARRSSSDRPIRDHARLGDLFDRMEPDLRLLNGTVSVLRCLSETSDAVEPVALQAVAHLAGEVLERIDAGWREATGVLRGR